MIGTAWQFDWQHVLSTWFTQHLYMLHVLHACHAWVWDTGDHHHVFLTYAMPA